MVERAKAFGANQQKMDETVRQAEQFKLIYHNPLINVAMTFKQYNSVKLVTLELAKKPKAIALEDGGADKGSENVIGKCHPADTCESFCGGAKDSGPDREGEPSVDAEMLPYRPPDGPEMRGQTNGEGQHRHPNIKFFGIAVSQDTEFEKRHADQHHDHRVVPNPGVVERVAVIAVNALRTEGEQLKIAAQMRARILF